MSLDFVFVPAIDDSSFLNSLDTGLALASKSKGHLFACHLEQRYPTNDVALAYWEASTVQALEADVTARRKRLEGLFYSFCSERRVDVVDADSLPTKGGVTASWKVAEASPFEDFGLVARCADICALSRASDEASPLTPNVREDLLTSSGIPLLNVPAGQRLSDVKKVLIGWNGSVEAKRAITAAMPLIETAQSAHVLSAGGTKGVRPSASDVAAVLNRKGIKATAEDRDDKSSTDDQLVAAAKDGGYHLLVIGAYSKPRWREVMFGGMTKRMLNDPPLPVLLMN